MNDLKKEHSISSIALRLSKKRKQNYLRDWIYGGIDGSITTFAVVSGVVGGKLSPFIIIILGLANLIADGFSMAASNFVGTKSEIDLYKKYKVTEEQHIELIPEGEVEEIRQIFKKKGFRGKNLDIIVNEITSNKELWIDTMLKEEYGLPSEYSNPFTAALCTFISFIAFGSIPLLPFVIGASSPFAISVILTLVVFFIIGSVKSYWSENSWFKSGIQTLLIGAFAASLAFVVGTLLGPHFISK